MDDDLLGAFGGLEVDVDTSVADARSARIQAARDLAKQYSAKIEEDGWFNDPKEAARMKEPTRPILFSVHQLYFQKEWEKVVEKGLELLSIGVNETSEVIDLVLRAWQKTEGTIPSRKDDIVEVAKRWREYQTQPSICHIAAQILRSADSTSSCSSSSTSPLQSEALSASLASLRMNRALPPFLNTLRQILDSSHPLLAATLEDRSQLSIRKDEVADEIEALRLEEQERDTLEAVLGLHGEEKETEEGVGRDVRSL